MTYVESTFMYNPGLTDSCTTSKLAFYNLNYLTEHKFPPSKRHPDRKVLQSLTSQKTTPTTTRPTQKSTLKTTFRRKTIQRAIRSPTSPLQLLSLMNKNKVEHLISNKNNNRNVNNPNSKYHIHNNSNNKSLQRQHQHLPIPACL